MTNPDIANQIAGERQPLPDFKFGITMKVASSPGRPEHEELR